MEEEQQITKSLLVGRPSEHTKLPVFVYGTLKRGFGNHRYLEGEEFLGTGSILGTLFDLGPFPGFSAEGTTQVKGELFSITRQTLARLDILEGVGVLYRRIIQDVKKEDNTSIKAWVYEIIRKDRNFAFRKAIESGEWAKVPQTWVG